MNRGFFGSVVQLVTNVFKSLENWRRDIFAFLKSLHCSDFFLSNFENSFRYFHFEVIIVPITGD